MNLQDQEITERLRSEYEYLGMTKNRVQTVKKFLQYRQFAFQHTTDFPFWMHAWGQVVPGSDEPVKGEPYFYFQIDNPNFLNDVVKIMQIEKF